jgi:hypothetical protein
MKTATPNFAKFLAVLKGEGIGRMEEWKGGRHELERVGNAIQSFQDCRKAREVPGHAPGSDFR